MATPKDATVENAELGAKRLVISVAVATVVSIVMAPPNSATTHEPLNFIYLP